MGLFLAAGAKIGPGGCEPVNPLEIDPKTRTLIARVGEREETEGWWQENTGLRGRGESYPPIPGIRRSRPSEIS